jgi:hypothetical protein
MTTWKGNAIRSQRKCFILCQSHSCTPATVPSILIIIIFFPFLAIVAPLFSCGHALSFCYDSHLSFPIAELLWRENLNYLRSSQVLICMGGYRIQPRPLQDAIQQVLTKFNRQRKQFISRMIWISHSGGYEEFWDITPCSQLNVNRRFGGKCRLRLQGRRISRAQRESRWQVGRRHVPPKRRLTFDGLQGVISHKIETPQFVYHLTMLSVDPSI